MTTFFYDECGQYGAIEFIAPEDATYLRIFHNGNYDKFSWWSLDAAIDEQRFTLETHKFQTLEQAVEGVPEFMKEYGVSTDTVVVVNLSRPTA